MSHIAQYLLGFDVGSSSIKATIIDADNGHIVGSATSPKEEMPMQSDRPGWAEQDPEMWWQHVVNATNEIKIRYNIEVEDIIAIGISYQMHGLVMVDKDLQVLRPSIIWCDSRAVEIGKKAFKEIGAEYSLSHLLNSPGNFTASKLKWVKDNEPEIYSKIHKIMLPGDYIALKLTGEVKTTISGLSEGIMWDFKNHQLADDLLEYFSFEKEFIPDLAPTFSVQGELTKKAAEELGLNPGTKVAYRAGDQPNNAFSLNVLNPGEIAATAGTSGVIYGINDKAEFDPKSRVNTFVHVNHNKKKPRYGVLLCVNGTGILNSWLKRNIAGEELDYEGMNELAAKSPVGSDGLVVLPFGNGAERMLENNDIKAQIHGLNFNRHHQSDILRAAQEGIVFALNYGFNIMQGMGMETKIVKAGQANMFLSPIFKEAFANTTGATVELYNTDGSQGAARGAGVGAGIFTDPKDAFIGLKALETIEPKKDKQAVYREAYEKWKSHLEQNFK